MNIINEEANKTYGNGNFLPLTVSQVYNDQGIMRIANNPSQWIETTEALSPPIVYNLVNEPINLHWKRVSGALFQLHPWDKPVPNNIKCFKVNNINEKILTICKA